MEIVGKPIVSIRARINRRDATATSSGTVGEVPSADKGSAEAARYFEGCRFENVLADRGFRLSDLSAGSIALAPPRVVWAETRRCSKCSGAGDYACRSCGGARQINCGGCRNGWAKCGNFSCSSGRARCSSCSGSGRVQQGRMGPQGYVYSYEACIYCQGQGSTVCSSCGGRGGRTCGRCNGQGKVTCSSCGPDGRTKCGKCDATGALSTKRTVGCELRIRKVALTVGNMRRTDNKRILQAMRERGVPLHAVERLESGKNIQAHYEPEDVLTRDFDAENRQRNYYLGRQLLVSIPEGIWARICGALGV